MAVYGYARVSTNEQNLDRQIEQIRPYLEDERYLFCDKASGKNFDRRAYKALVGSSETLPLLHEHDLLVILSLDRLGRNYEDIREQWRHITNILKADIKIIDMPLLDTRGGSGTLDGRFISDLVLQILSYNAQKERENIIRRQREGIDIAKIKGKHFGRPEIPFPENWNEIYEEWKAERITAVKAMERLHLKANTFYKFAKDTCENQKSVRGEKIS